MNPTSLLGLVLANALALVLRASVSAAPAAQRDTNICTLKLLVVNFDPVLTNHGGVRLRQHLKWNDPRPMTTNLMRYIREASGGFARYQLVEWIDVNAFPQKRDLFRYDEESFLAMWKDADPEIPVLKEAKVEYAKLQ